MAFLKLEENSNDNVSITAKSKNTTVKSTAKYYLVRNKDLPLSCPMRGKEGWSSHPRVYLPIEDSDGEINCPYCGAGYVLEKE